jgi:hypothetical protein
MGLASKVLFSEPRKGTDQPEVKAAPAERASGAGADAIARENELSKVRDLLFGPQIREQRDEIHRLEDQLVRQGTTLREILEDLGKNLGTLERLVRCESNTALERCNTESRERKTAVDVIGKRVDEMGHQFDAKLAEIDERTRRGERELRDHLLSQTKLLSDAITQHHEDAVRLVNEGMRDLRASKVDRAALAAILVQVGMRLDAESAAAAVATAPKG